MFICNAWLQNCINDTRDFKIFHKNWSSGPIPNYKKILLFVQSDLDPDQVKLGPRPQHEHQTQERDFPTLLENLTDDAIA